MDEEMELEFNDKIMNASTGFVAVILVLASGGIPFLYGFTPNCNGYNIYTKKNGTHDYDLEHLILEGWDDKDLIRMYL